MKIKSKREERILITGVKWGFKFSSIINKIADEAWWEALWGQELLSKDRSEDTVRKIGEAAERITGVAPCEDTTKGVYEPGEAEFERGYQEGYEAGVMESAIPCQEQIDQCVNDSYQDGYSDCRREYETKLADKDEEYKDALKVAYAAAWDDGYDAHEREMRDYTDREYDDA